MDFYPDSLIFTNTERDKVKWKASKSKIEFYLPTIITDSFIKDKITVSYELSKEKDTLFGIFKNRLGNNTFNLLRARNYIEYLNKRYKIDFSLPESDSVNSIETDHIYGLNVFIGYLNNKIIGKTLHSNSLNNLERDVNTFKDSIKSNKRYPIDIHEKNLHLKFHLRVFADKNIADSTITKLLSVKIKNKLASFNKHRPEVFYYKLTDTVPIQIFRVYQTDEHEREILGILKGKRIKSNAYNCFN